MTEPAAKPLLDEEPDAKETDKVELIPKAQYEEALEQLRQAKTYEQKAALLDELMEDPEFDGFLKGDKTAAPKAPVEKPIEEKTLADFIEEAVIKATTPLKADLDMLKGEYKSGKETLTRVEADREIQRLLADKENFPLFNEKDVQIAMAKVLENGRAMNMADAYMIATYGHAKASGRKEVIDQSKKSALPPGRKIELGARNKEALQERRSLRDILNEAADATGFEAGEEETD
jgi:hypothetical protein